MCIIIVNNRKSKLAKTTLENAFDANPDGIGFAFATKSGIVIKKFMGNNKAAIDYYYSVARKESIGEILIHARIATHGAVNEKYCHPFIVNKNLCFAHNGILHGYGTLQHSDTVDFNDKVLKKLPEEFYKNPAIMALIGASIGYSKFAFLDEQGKAYIVNEGSGHWDKTRNWYSNDSYKDRLNWWEYDSTIIRKKNTKKLGGIAEEWEATPCVTCRDFDCEGCGFYQDLYKTK